MQQAACRAAEGAGSWLCPITVPLGLSSFPVVTRVSMREMEEPGRSKSQMLDGDSTDVPALQVQALRNGESVDKPIYNHVTGLLDPPEKTKSPHVCSPSMARLSRSAVCSFYVSAPCCQPPIAPAAQALGQMSCGSLCISQCQLVTLAASLQHLPQSALYNEPPNTPSRHMPALHRRITRWRTAGSSMSPPPQSSALRTSAWKLPPTPDHLPVDPGH